MTAPPLHDWETFYVIVGSSAAALTGLQFVVIALISEAQGLGNEESVKAFGTPTVVHFCAVLLIAAIASTPKHSVLTLSACLTAMAIIALGYSTRVVLRAKRQTAYQPVWEDWLWHAILPLVAYTALLAAGLIVHAHAEAALYVVAAAALLLLYIGIHNAWDTALYISTRRQEEEMPASNQKETAIDFLRKAASGDVREAYRKYVGPRFRHHNVYFKGDAESLMLGMEENAKQNPDKTLEIKHALHDGDLVAVHSHVRMNPGDRGVALVHIFRFEGDRIAELWDLGQPVPETSPNEYGMF